MLSIINQNPSPISGPDLLHQLVAPSSTAIAIDFLENGSKRRKFSYKTLHALSDALAQNISRTLGKLENASIIVPVLLPQGPDLYVALLAILKAGRAFCPLSLDTPAERLDFILRDISASLLITTSAHGKNLKIDSSQITRLHIDKDPFQEDENTTLARSNVQTSDLAYVLYTSGSTGQPKAVSVSHRAVTQSLLAHDRHIPHFSRFLQFAAPTFDVSIFEIFFPWYRGCTLTSRSRAQMLDNLPETIKLLDVDAAELTPTVVSNLLDGRSSVPSLRLLLTIGEMLTRDVIEEYGDSDARNGILWAMYGPTEAAIHCTLQPRISTDASTHVIGSPLDTVSAFVVAPLSDCDSPSEFSILPAGEEGELAIGGLQVAEEYLNRPEINARAFIHHPEYGYVYRTGDRAKLCVNGTFECLGRVATGQVKLRGQRIELGEVEQVIMKIDGCRAAAVIIIDDNLVAFCATGARHLSQSDVLSHCGRWLPDVMIPNDIVIMRRLPQLPSGKIDRSSLSTTYRKTSQGNGSETAVTSNGADNSLLELLQQHLKQVLRPETKLSSAGMDSLRAIRLASRLRTGGYQFTALQIMSATTVEDLLRAAKGTELSSDIEQKTHNIIQASPVDIPNLKPWLTKIVCTLPCTPLQEAMLVETIKRSSAYCNWVEVELSKPHTYDQIRSALEKLAQSNEILRSGFCSAAADQNAFVQIVWKGLASSQVEQVHDFSRTYSLATHDSLLRPWSAQIITHLEKPRLLLRIYHAIYDGWSLDLLLRDLTEVLDGADARQRPQFSEVVYFYEAQRQTPRSMNEAYWKEVLCDRPEVSLPNYNGKIVNGAKTQCVAGRSAVNLHALRGCSEHLMISPQVYFQAAVAFVQSLYLGSSDVVIGNVTAGRTIPITGIEDIIGPCIASIPFRLRFGELVRVRDILQETHRLNRESLEHCALPLRQIAKAANARAGTRLFDILFVWQQALETVSTSSTSARIVDSADELEVKLTLEFEPRPDHILFRATFDPSEIPEKQVKYLSQQIDEVVQLFLENADCTTVHIASCFSTELQSIANPTPRQSPLRQGPAYAVERWASTTPNKTALGIYHKVNSTMQVESTMTYAVLNSRANQVARMLLNHGVCQGAIVGVIMEKSVNLYVAILAVLKIGAGYLPIVPDLPSERTKTILSEAQVAACITDLSAPSHLRQSTSAKILDLDEIELDAYSDGNLKVFYNGVNVAYAVFTSGSTGTPKGVLVTQDNLMSNLDYLSTVYPYSKDSRLLQSCSQAFDVSVFEIFFSWHVGICLCTARKDDLFSDLEGAINQLEITHLSLTPTVAALVDPANVPRVEFLVTAGEALTEHVRRKWAGRGLYQGYGPSETTNICTVRPSVSPLDLINNIGRPFDNTSAFVLDPHGDTILPRGAVGELCFGGYQVFREYLNRPDLTAAKVINHPRYGRIYRSGDLGVLLHDDSILSTGRLDDQVKIRGQRVELGEISSAILDQQCVRDCATVLLRDSRDSELLVTFWVPVRSDDTEFRVLEAQNLRSDILSIFAALSQRLPSYMIPSHLLPISRLPMTAQGKIDRRKLQRCFVDLTAEVKERVAASYDDPNGADPPATLWEHQVAEALAETLRLPVEGIMRKSSFFNFGLDSVSAISFSNRLSNRDLGDFAISTILKNPTIAHLRQLVDTHSSVYYNPNSTKPNIEEALDPNTIAHVRDMFKERDDFIVKILPCTPLQEAMLSTGESTANSSYSNVLVFSISGDVTRLQQSWASMVQRHEILRTSFVATNDPSHAFVQVVLNDTDLDWSSIAWTRETLQHAHDRVDGLLHASKPPVWLVIARSESSTRLLFCCHHAVYDGIAIQSLLKEVQEVYHHRELPPQVFFDVYLQQMLSQNQPESDRFWKGIFQDFEPTSFPDLTGIARKGRIVSNSWHHPLSLPLSRIRKACQGTSVTLLSVIHATWAKLLHFYTGESDICFGNVVSGRALAGHGVERLVAPCFNTLPVRINFNFCDENVALAHQAHSLNIESLAFQLTPLRRIQNIALKEGGQLFDTLVILQQPNEPLDGTIWTLEEDHGVMDLPLVCEISQNETEDRVDLILHYHSTIVSRKEAALIAETFEACLKNTVELPHVSAHDTNGFPRHLRAESDPIIEFPEIEPQFMHSGFENIANTTPDQIAVDFLHTDGEKTTWSFRTLNERANSIAHELILLGVKPEDIVPVHMFKSPSFYASILGVLKAGAAFTPVHPGLPDARKRLMIADLKAKYVLHNKDSLQPSIADGVTLVDVDTLKHAARDNPIITDFSNSNIAYCIFTSGSTGVPKAVSVEHRAPIRTIQCSGSIVPWTSSSRLLQYAAPTFDMCYYDCFLAWTLGFTLCAADQDMMQNDLPKIINDLDVDLLDLTPSVAASLVRSEVPEVRWLYCIGEAMTTSIVSDWVGACVNSYGPSEAAFCTTIYPVSKDTKPSVIGKPFPSTRFAIFPTHGDNPLPPLSMGELCIGGAQLARGYHSRPDLTKEKFIVKSGQRFYRSGDLVRQLVDGDFEFIGRTDDQIKIRGLRVELGEINNTLREAHVDIESAVTQIMKKDADAKEQLVTFLATKRSSNDGEREDLRRSLREVAKDRLPSYMIPQFLIFVDQIPRSLAGKVDKKALAEIFHLSADFNTPHGISNSTSKHRWTALEGRVRDVLAHLSKSTLEDVSPTTTIYQLGLDSISAVQVAAALRKDGHNVKASDVMKHLTCVDLAEFLDRDAAAEHINAVRFDFEAFDKSHRQDILASCRINNEDVMAIHPCTPLQMGMVSQMLAKDGAVYINFLRLELDRGVDLVRLKEAWREVMTTHQMLRTGFAHLKDKYHPFGMIEYTPHAVTLPFDGLPSQHISESADVWFEEIKHTMAAKMHRPPWHIRMVREEDCTYLDLAIFHGLFDAQSLHLIFRDVTLAYRGQRNEPPLAKLTSVIDAILQRSKGYSEETKEFWTRMGKGSVPCRFPNLAPLRYEPRSPTIRTHRSRRSLSEIESACRQSNTTLQAVGIASWLSLISAYTGEPTATCGIVLSGRDSEATERAVFPCINTVPISHNMTTNTKEILSRTTGLLARIQQYQHIPLNETQRLMGHPNNALFDTIFAYQKLPSQDDVDGFWTVLDEKATIEYPVSIELEPKGVHLEYRLTFMPHVIPWQQAKLMLEQLDHLMERFVSPDMHDTTFDASCYSITPAKQPKLVSEAQLLHGFVELTAEQHPERVALEFANSIYAGDYSAQRWTYSELDAEGNRVANLLIASGVQPGDLVGVCFDKCPEASFGMLGVLKAGAAFVAIDPGAPAARQTFIIGDSGAAAVLSMSSQSVQFTQDISVPIINLDATSRATTPSTRPVLSRTITTQDRSYCLYTSGTTGSPKGCELTHENAVQALLSFQRLFAGHWDTTSRWLQFASFHFDVSVLEQYWSWSVGICVVSAPRDVIFEDLPSSIRTLGITHIDLTPSLAQILHPDDVPTLCKGVFITGGESLKQEILDVWGPKGVIYNGYGPTEATIGCTMYPRVPANGKPSNIGPQFDNVGSFVLRPSTDIPVLRGGIGELCVSGKLVGKGYLNRKDLTERSFPYLERFKERVYRTGDMVRILHDGTFEFLGRSDDQVKLRGQRLEIGEINSVIRQSSDSISDVATLVLKHPRQQKEQLIAFLVRGRTTGHPQVELGDASELMIAKDACHDKLPPYMVPTHFVPLTSMPLNANNKADVKKLKEIYDGLSVADLQQLSMGSGEREGSLSGQEMKLCKVLMEELDVSKDAVGKETSFFELGMDSISVMGVVRSAKQVGFTSATASLVMKHSTIRRLAKALSARNRHKSDRASVLAAQQAIAATQHRHRRTAARSLFVSVTDIETLAPCTPLQQGMIARSLESDDGLYFNTFLFQLSEKADRNGLEAAWQKVQASTQILRTVFVDTEDGYLQVVLRDTVSGIRSINVHKDETLHDCIDGAHKDWLRSNRNGFRFPFELRYLQTPEKRMLVVQIFHGLYDGISIELLFKAVWDLYNGRQSSNNAPSFQSALAHGPLRVMDGAKTFWQKHLSQDVAPLPTQFMIDSSSKPIKITRELEALPALESTRRKLNVTAQTIVQSCWLHALQKQKKATTTVGIVVSGRSIDLEGVDHTIGPMFNTMPYRHRPQNGESWATIIKRVHDFNVAAHPYQHTPLRNIMKWCKTDRNQPLFDSLFVYQVTQENGEWAKNDLWELLDGDTIADYPLAFEIEQKPGGKWSLTLVAQSHAVDRRTALKLLDQFEEALHQATNDPSTTVKSSVDRNGTTMRPDGDVNGTIGHINGATNFVWTRGAEVLRRLLAETTGSELQDINESTSIFELGLDSIDAIKLSSKLKKHNVDLPVSGIMRGLTIAKMIPYIKTRNDAMQQASSKDSEFRERKRELGGYMKRQGVSLSQIEAALPLTPLQEAMVAEMITSDFTRYYNFDVMEFTQDTNPERLRAAWTRVVEANSILRTSFVEIDDPDIDESFAQTIHAKPHRFWREVTLTCKPDFPALFDQVRREAKRATSSEPPFHVLLVNSPHQTHLLLAIAHALYDGWSLGLLHADVKRAYHGQLKPRPDYQDTLSAILRSPDEDSSVFWENYLMDVTPSAFPRQSKPFDGRQETVHRSEYESRTLVADLAKFAQKNNISLQTMGQSIFAIVLASYVQSLDVTFGCVLSGRDDEIASQVIFPTMSTVVIRTILHGTCLELLRHVQDSFTDVKEWQHLPLRRVLEHGGVHGGLFESLFIYQKSMDNILDDQELYTSVEGHSDVEYPVCVEMEVVNDKLIWRCAVKDEVFNLADAKELLARLDQVLSEVMHRPDQPVIEFTPQGTSVCNLPPFETHDSSESSSDGTTGKGQSYDGMPLRPETVLAIRNVLAIVADVADGDVTDDMTIFHLGLDSISAIKVSSLLRQQKVILSVGDMLRAGSVRDMARIANARVSQHQEPSEDHAAVIEKTLQELDYDEILRRANAERCRIGNIDEVQLLPATPGQVYMMAMWLKTEGSNFYPEFIYTLSGNFSFEKLQDSWSALVAATPILRTYFVATQDERTPYVQLVRKKQELQPIVINLAEDITTGSEMVQPWARLRVAQTDNGWTLKLKIHHALYDGVSLPILMRQLQDICNEGTVPAPDNQFEKIVANGLESETCESFWKSYLHGIEQSHLSQPQSTISTRSEVFVPGLLPTKALEDTSRRHGISIQALFLVAYAKIYAKLTGTPKDSVVVLGIYLANRSHPVPGLERAAIPTVNLLPLRVCAPLEQSTIYAARQVQKDLQRIGEMANASASLHEIKKWTGIMVDTFVNFLTLPVAEDTQDTRGIKIMPKSEWTEGVSRVQEHEVMFQNEDEERFWSLRNEEVNGAYLHAIDIEATVCSGALDVGIFAPVEMMDLQDGNKLLEDLRVELMAI